MKNEKELKMREMIDLAFPEIGDLRPIYDGYMNYDLYDKAKLKVMWVLKEPYDSFEDGTPFGGGWGLGDDLGKKTSLANKTQLMMAQVNECIQTGLTKISKSELDRMRREPSIVSFLGSLVHINIKKYPGKTSSNYHEIEESYAKNKDLILRQIFLISPDVIIFGVGSLFDLEIKKDFHFQKKDMQWTDESSYYYWGNRLIIEARHPGKPGLEKEEYVNDILSVIAKWKMERCLQARA